MVIFGIILRIISSKYTPRHTKLHHFAKFSQRNLPPNTFAMHSMLCRDTSGKMICTPLLNPVMLMYAHLSLFGNKMTIKKVHFSQFLKGPLQFIKITLHWLYQLFCKNTTLKVFTYLLNDT